MSKQTEIQWGKVAIDSIPVSTNGRKETEIGEIPEHWEVLSIGEFANVTKLSGFEFTEHFKYIDDGEIIALRALNIKDGNLDLSNVKRVPKQVSNNLIRSKLFIGDILLTYTGTIGQFAIIDEDDKYHLAPNVCRIRTGEKCLSHFLLYYFRSPFFRDNLENYCVGSTQLTMPMGNIRQILVPLPSLNEQSKIVSIIRSLEEKIRLLHRQNTTLEAIAETLFRQWFIEEAKEEWEEGVVGDLVEFTYGKALKDQDRTGSGYPVYGSNGVVGYHNQYLVEGPGIVTGRKGTLGVVNYSFRNFFPIDTAFYIISKINSKGLYFEFFLLKNLKLEHSNTDSAVPGLNRNIAHSMRISVPPIEKIHAFNEHIEPYFRKTEVNQIQIQTLSTLRDTLLPKLMSGEVRVSY